jgi:hypothetical protein
MYGRRSDSQMRGFNYCQSCASRSVNESPGRARRAPTAKRPSLGEHFDVVVGLSSHNARERLRFILGHALIRHAQESGRQRLNVLTSPL